MKLRLLRKILVRALWFATICFENAKASGAPLQLTYPGMGSPLNTPSLQAFLFFVFQLALILAAILVFTITVSAGLKYIASFGKPEALQRAKEDILAAFMGFLILLSAVVILNAIDPSLTKLKLALNDFTPSLIPTPKETVKTDYYLAVPVGQILSSYYYSPKGLQLWADILEPADSLLALQKNTEELSDKLMAEIGECRCGMSVCGIDCPCKGTTPNARCDQVKIHEIVAKLQINVEQLQARKKEMETKWENMQPAILATQNALSAQSLADANEIEPYLGFLASRESAGANLDIIIDTDKFAEWKNPWEGNKADPFGFYLNKKQSQKIIDAILSANEEKTGEFDSPNVPDNPDNIADIPAKSFAPTSDYPFFSQYDGPWGNCCRRASGCRGSIVYLGRTGCADTSLAMAVAFWYANDSNVKTKWDAMLRQDPVPNRMSSASSKGTNCYNAYPGNSPDPYEFLYYMNKTGANTANGSWNERKLYSLLSSLGLAMGSMRKMSFNDVVDVAQTNKSVILFCDLFGRDYRDCSGGSRAFKCNHYVLAKGISDNGDLIIHNPAGKQNDYPSFLSPALFNSYGCGKGYGEETNFIIYPK